MTTDYIESFPQQDTSGSEQVTMFADDTEDLMRKFLYNLFDLSYNEIQVLKGIMNQKDLSSIALEIQENAKKNQVVSRHKIFQTRKAILTKLGKRYSQALLTKGQRKQLKQ